MTFTAIVAGATISGSQIAPIGLIVASLLGGAVRATESTQVTSSERVRTRQIGGTATIRRIKQDGSRD